MALPGKQSRQYRPLERQRRYARLGAEVVSMATMEEAGTGLASEFGTSLMNRTWFVRRSRTSTTSNAMSLKKSSGLAEDQGIPVLLVRSNTLPDVPDECASTNASCLIQEIHRSVAALEATGVDRLGAEVVDLL